MIGKARPCILHTVKQSMYLDPKIA